MKLSVSTYSFGKYEKELGIKGLIDKAASMGFEGIEFVEGAFMDDTDNADLIRKCASDAGIEVVSFAVGGEFIKKNPDDEMKTVCRKIEFASRAGARMLRHDVTRGFDSEKRHTRGYGDALPILTEYCTRITEFAQTLGVRTMTENHGNFSQDSIRVEQLINAVSHDNFGALVDMGNFMCADENPAAAVGVMAPYAFFVHAKDFFLKSGMLADPGRGWFKTRGGNYLRPTIIGHGDACIAQSVKTMKRAGYDGYITVEFEGIEDNIMGIEYGAANLRRMISES